MNIKDDLEQPSRWNKLKRTLKKGVKTILLKNFSL